MENEAVKRYLEIWDMAREDPEYQRLHHQYCAARRHFLKLMEGMIPAQQDVILDYIAAGADLHLRLMELANQ